MFATNHLQGARLLVGDLDPSRRFELQHALGAYGADVTSAASGFELLAWLADRGPFDAVISGSGLVQPILRDVLALTCSTVLDVGVIALAPPGEANRLRHRELGLLVLDEPCTDLDLAREVDQMVETSRRFHGARCVVAHCARCGRAHLIATSMVDELVDAPEHELGGEA